MDEPSLLDNDVNEELVKLKEYVSELEENNRLLRTQIEILQWRLREQD